MGSSKYKHGYGQVRQLISHKLRLRLALYVIIFVVGACKTKTALTSARHHDISYTPCPSKGGGWRDRLGITPLQGRVNRGVINAHR